VADDYDEYEDEEEAPKPKPKRPRKPIDWPLVVMLVGTLVFLLIFGLITLMAPRRPFLLLRSGQSAKPAATVVSSTGGPGVPGGAAAPTGGGTPAPAPTPAAPGSSAPAATVVPAKP